MSVFRAWAVVERPWPIKIAKLWLTKKGGEKGSDVELRREYAYDSNGTDLHMGLYVLSWLRYGENCKASCRNVEYHM
jgi:hypothetical protein